MSQTVTVAAPDCPRATAWTIQTYPRAWVVDLTRGWWPRACQARALVDGRGWQCTRRCRHTGRHAAGAGGRVVAVW